MKLDAGMQALVNAACRGTARLIEQVVCTRLEEHCDDPAERWRLLRVALRRFGAEPRL